jgi:hypothetical protein
MSKYDPLLRWFRSSRGNHVQLTFEQIEEILGSDLPDSARKHRSWWGNEGL